MNQAYLFVDLATRYVTLVRLPIDGQCEPEGQIYETIECTQEAVSQVLDVSYGDADGILMAADMQGRDWVLETIDADWYVTLRRVPEVVEQLPRRLNFNDGGRDESLLERIRGALAVKSLETRQ